VPQDIPCPTLDPPSAEVYDSIVLAPMDRSRKKESRKKPQEQGSVCFEYVSCIDIDILF
jgi:hypothetical protein